MKTPETFAKPTNHHLWQTFKMEEIMRTSVTPKPAKQFWLILVIAVTLLLGACSQQPMTEQAEGLEAQFGSSSPEYAGDAAGTSTGIYAVGETYGSLAGPNQGSADAYIRKYSFSGNVLWQSQFGTSQYDDARNIAIHNDKIYVLGRTTGSLNGNLGGVDIFLRQYNDNGAVGWTRQFGTSGFDIAADVTTDTNGNAIVLSKDNITTTGFKIRKVTPTGVVSTLVTWSPWLAVAIFYPQAIATDSSNNIYVLANYTFNNTPSSHIFKFNSSGLELGGTSTKGTNEYGRDLTVFDNRIYVVLHESGINKIKKFSTTLTFSSSTLPLAVVTPDSSLDLKAIKVSGGSLYLAGSASAAKYSTNLVKQWEKKNILGPNAHSVTGFGLAVSGVSNAVYPVGADYALEDAYIAKVDMTTGSVAWTR